MEQTNKILFKEHKKSDGSFVAEVKLANPKAFNALTSDMILDLKNHLEKWKENPNISLVFIHGEGERAFCAGGDVKQLFYGIVNCRKQNKDPGLFVQSFFENEYRMNYLMHTYPKPIVLWGNGIVMGGGLGLFVAASHSIVTESSLFSMPEISIGLFPDVGGSYFLSQLEKNLGFYLALTACRFNGAEALFLNFSQLAFKDLHKQEVFDFLLSLSFAGKEEFDKKIKDFQEEKSFSLDQENWLKKYRDEIYQLVESKNIQVIYEKFKTTKLEDKKWLKNKETFLKGSPSSGGVICEQLKRGENLSLKEVFKMELIMAMQHARHFDFQEGVRALLIDKTGAPIWNPDHVKKLKNSWIQEHFKSLSGWTNPLDNL